MLVCIDADEQIQESFDLEEVEIIKPMTFSEMKTFSFDSAAIVASRIYDRAAYGCVLYSHMREASVVCFMNFVFISLLMNFVFILQQTECMTRRQGKFAHYLLDRFRTIGKEACIMLRGM